MSHMGILTLDMKLLSSKRQILEQAANNSRNEFISSYRLRFDDCPPSPRLSLKTKLMFKRQSTRCSDRGHVRGPLLNVLSEVINGKAL